MSLNKVMLIGNCGKTPEVRNLENGKVVQFPLATSEKYKDRSGNYREDTTWHDCVAFGSIADIIERYVGKGTTVYVEGKIRKRKFTDNSGYERTVTEVVVNTIQLVGGKSQEGNNNSRGGDEF